MERMWLARDYVNVTMPSRSRGVVQARPGKLDLLQLAQNLAAEGHCQRKLA